jgi:hypothetical protein
LFVIFEDFFFFFVGGMKKINFFQNTLFSLDIFCKLIINDSATRSNLIFVIRLKKQIILVFLHETKKKVQNSNKKKQK